MKRSSINRVRGFWTAVITVAAVLFACAEVPGAELPEIRYRFVPKDKPQTWWPDRKTDWIPIARERLEVLLESIRESDVDDAGFAFDRAIYQAEFDPDSTSLVSGVASLDRSSSRGRDGLIRFSPANLAISSVEWPEREKPALFGSDQNGTQYVAYEPDARKLALEWSLSGTRRLSGVTFDVRLPAAITSSMLLTLPADWALSSSVGMVSPVLLQQDKVVYRVNAGSRNEFELRLVKMNVEDSPTESDLIAIRLLTSRFVLHSDRVESAFRVVLQSLPSTVESIEVDVPDGVQILAVERANGNELVWRDQGVRSKARRRIKIQLPDVVSTSEQGFVIRASEPFDPTRSCRLAVLQVADSVLLEGTMTAEVGLPYSIENYKPSGLRQTDVSVEPDSTRLEFQQIQADANLVLDVSPAARMAARLANVDVICVARLDQSPAVLHADFELSTATRGLFSIDALIPSRWKVTGVTRESGPSGITRPGWNVSRVEDGQSSRLTIDLPDGLTVGRTTRIRVNAQLSDAGSNQQISIPAVFPSGIGTAHLKLAVIGRDSSSVSIQAAENSSFKEFDLTQESAESASSRLFADLLKDPSTAEVATFWTADYRETPGGLVDSVLEFADDEQSTGAPDAEESADALPLTERSPEEVQSGSDSGESGDAGQDDPSKPVVQVELRSILSPGTAGRDLHRVTWRFLYSGAADTFRFSLPSGAELVSVKWNGEPVATTRLDRIRELPIPATASGDSLSVEYSLASQEIYLRETYRCRIPEADATPIGFQWNVQTRPNFRIVSFSSEMTSVSTIEPEGALPWFFGPLARGTNRVPFSPFSIDSWMELFTAESAPEKASSEDSDKWFAAVGTSGNIPESLTLHLCRTDRVRALSWFILIISLLIGVLLRTGRLGARNRLGMLWLSGCVASAMIIPDVFAELVGASVVGVVLATLLPRKLVRRESPGPDVAAQITVPSTVSLVRVGSAVTLVFIAILCRSADGQNSDQRPPQKIDILVPWDAKTFPPNKEVEHVFIKRFVLDWLNAQVVAKSLGRVRYLMERAEWHGEIRESNSVQIQGSLDIAVRSNDDRDIELPVSTSLLSAREPVLLDGKPADIAPSADGQRLVIRVPKPRSDPEEFESTIERPAAPPLPESVPLFDAHSEGWTRHRLTLSLRGRSSADAPADSVDFQIPSVAQCTLALTLPATSASLIDRDRLVSYSAGANAAIVLTPGMKSNIRLRRSDLSTDLPNSTLEVSLDSSLELHPTWIDRSTLATYSLQEKTLVRRLAWRLPRGARIRLADIEAEQLVDATVRAENDGVIVTLEFDPPLKSEFSLHMKWKQYLTDSSDTPAIQWEMPIPVTGTEDLIELASHSAGISAATGFSLAESVTESTRPTKMPADEWAATWPESQRPRNPQTAFRVNHEHALPTTVAAVKIEQKAFPELNAYVHGDTIEWNISVEIETSNAAAFRHELVVPEELRIESVSVQQNEVDRLSHWEHRDDRLFLLLRDRSVGRQFVQIRGRTQLERRQKTPVPHVSLAIGETAESALRIFCHPGIEVAVTGAEASDSIAGPVDPAVRPLIPAGRFRLKDQPEAYLEVSQSRPDASAVVIGEFRQAEDKNLRCHVSVFLSSEHRDEWVVKLPAWVVGEPEMIVSPNSSVKNAVVDSNSRIIRVQTSFRGTHEFQFTARCLMENMQAAALTSPVVVETVQTRSLLEMNDYWLDAFGRIHPNVDDDDEVTVALRSLGVREERLTRLRVWPDELNPVSIPQSETSQRIPTIVLHSIITGGRRPATYTTRILHQSEEPGQLQIAWPEGASPVSMRMNGRFLNADSNGKRIQRIPFGAEQGLFFVEVLWKQDRPTSQLKVRRFSQPLPVVSAGFRTSVFAMVSAVPGFEIISAVDVPGGNDVERGFLSSADRWEAQLAELTGESQLRADILKVLAATRMWIARVGEESNSSAEEAGAVVTSPTNVSSRTSRPMEQAEVHDSDSTFGKGLFVEIHDEPTLRLWIVDQRLNRILAGLAAAVVSFPFLVIFFRTETSNRFARYPAVCFVLLGATWWLCLKVSIGGFIVMLTAAIWLTLSLVRKLQRPIRSQAPNELREAF